MQIRHRSDSLKQKTVNSLSPQVCVLESCQQCLLVSFKSVATLLNTELDNCAVNVRRVENDVCILIGLDVHVGDLFQNVDAEDELPSLCLAGNYTLILLAKRLHVASEPELLELDDTTLVGAFLGEDLAHFDYLELELDGQTLLLVVQIAKCNLNT